MRLVYLESWCHITVLICSCFVRSAYNVKNLALQLDVPLNAAGRWSICLVEWKSGLSISLLTSFREYI